MAITRRRLWALPPLVILLGAAVLAAHATRPQGEQFDLVLVGGRVLDPETALDAKRNVGIRGGRIAALTAQPLAARETLDVSGLVVAPGFIDLHAHGQDSESYRYYAHDGVTTESCPWAWRSMNPGAQAGFGGHAVVRVVAVALRILP